MPNLNVFNHPDLPLYTYATATVGFISLTESVTATPITGNASVRDASTYRIYTFAAKNAGAVSAWVTLEISPDNVTWIVDGPEQEIVPGSMLALTPRFFLRYTRLAFRTTSGITPLFIWWQAQG